MQCFKLFDGLFILTALCTGCRYDDSTIWKQFNTIELRIKALEERCDRMNTDISSLHDIILAMQNRDYVTGVSPIKQGSGILGYTITFKNAQPITVYNGKDGEDGANGANGKDGNTPTISVRQGEDGIWYWTLNGEWLLANGERIPASAKDGLDGTDGVDGSDGNDGITPRLKIVDGYWYISYDNEKTWSVVGKATGDSGLPGKDGDTVFKAVDVRDGYVVFTLNDATSTEIKLPFLAEGELFLESLYEGHIMKLLSDEQKRSTTHLTITGVISPDDVRYIADQVLPLEILDLSGTNLTVLPSRCFCRGSLKYGKDTLKDVFLPDSCVEIGNEAFYGSVNLRKVVARNAILKGTPFKFNNHLELLELGQVEGGGGFEECTIQSLHLFGNRLFISGVTYNVQLDSITVTYSNRDGYGRLQIGNDGGLDRCEYLSFDPVADRDISEVYFDGSFNELILPSSIETIKAGDLRVKDNSNVIALNNSSIQSYSHSGNINNIYWYPKRLPNYLYYKPDGFDNKIGHFFVRRSLLPQFKEKWGTIDFQPLEDSEYYKSHPKFQ